MKKIWKRWGALLLAAVMTLSLFPTAALAAGETAWPITLSEWHIYKNTSVTAAPTRSSDGKLVLPAAGSNDYWKNGSSPLYTNPIINDAIANTTGEKFIQFKVSASATSGNTPNFGVIINAGDGTNKGYRFGYDNYSKWFQECYTGTTDSDKAGWARDTTSAAMSNDEEHMVKVVWTDQSAVAVYLDGTSKGFTTPSNFASLPTTNVICFMAGGSTTLTISELTYSGQKAENELLSVSGTVKFGGVGVGGATVSLGPDSDYPNSATTDANGNFTVRMYPTGDNSSIPLTVGKTGYDTYTENLDFSGGTAITGKEIALQGPSRTVEGTVTDSAGAGLAGATVTLVANSATYNTVAGVKAVTNADGSYSMVVNSVAAGSYKVRAAKAEYGAAIGETVVTLGGAVTADETIAGGAVALTKIDVDNARFKYDFTEGHTPELEVPSTTVGTRPSVRIQNDSLIMSFTSTERFDNLIRIKGSNVKNGTVEFDATRTGTYSNPGRFGLAMRLKESGTWIYVGQWNTDTKWACESFHSDYDVSDWHDRSEVEGPSFGKGDTRHFKVQLEDNIVRLWVDGIKIYEQDLSNSGRPVPSEAADVGFVCGNEGNYGVPSTVTIDNLYIFRDDASYGVELRQDATKNPLVAKIVTTGGEEDLDNGEAAAGDPVKISAENTTVDGVVYALDTVRVVNDNDISSTVEVTREGDGFIFDMPEFAVQVTGVWKKALTGVSVADDGHVEVGEELQATLEPGGATASYQWYRVSDGTETAITGATGAAYTVTDDDLGAALKVTATGSGEYTGTKTSAATGVVTKAVTGVSLSADTLSIALNSTTATTLTATISPANATNKALTWTSSNESVATVAGEEVDGAVQADDQGRNIATITPKAVGETTITVTTADGSFSASCQVTVLAAGATDVILPDGQHSVTLYYNDQSSKTFQLTATVTPAEATDKSVRWTTSDASVATVSDSGLVTAVGAGNATITVALAGNASIFATCEVTVRARPEQVTVDPTSVTLYTNTGDANHERDVVATVSPEGTGGRLRWTTSNANVATVSNTGRITGQRNGTATITATVLDPDTGASTGVTASVSVTVKTKLEGEVTVSGAAKFESELTADLNDIAEEAQSYLTFQWYRGAAAEGDVLATGQTYTPVEEDIGSVLTVKVTASDPYEGYATATTAPIARADGHEMFEAEPTHVNCSAADASDGKIVGLHADHLYQYQKQNEDGTWPEAWEDLAPNSTEITGLGVGSYRVRHAGDNTREPGEPSNTVTIVAEGTTTYALIIPLDFPGGTVRANRSQIPEGSTVTLWVTPDEGYQLKAGSLTATRSDMPGAASEAITEEANGTYTFIMPAYAVQVNAAFEKKTYILKHKLSNITCDMEDHDHTAIHGEAFTVTLTPDEGYDMPDRIVVTDTLTGARYTDYTYRTSETDPTKRLVTFAHGVDRDITLTGAAELKTYPVSYDLTYASAGSSPTRIGWKQAFSAVFTPDAGYRLPERVTVTMDGSDRVSYSYDQETGALYIEEGIITGLLEIAVTAERVRTPLEKVSIQGVAQVGQRLTAVITPAEASGYVNFQWLWVNEDGTTEEIPGSVGRTGVISADSEGKAIRVRATAMDGSAYTGSVTSEATGTVVAAGAATVPAIGVDLRRTDVTIEAGKTLTLVATVRPTNATDKTLSWSSSNVDVATVENGVITAVAEGTAVITVTAANGSLSAECNVTVTPAMVVVASAEDVNATYDGNSHQIAVTVTNPAGGTGASVTYSADGVNFYSLNPSFSDAGDHPVWYKVAAPGLETYLGRANVNIAKATPEVSVVPSTTSLASAGTVTLTVTIPGYAAWEDLELFVSDASAQLTQLGNGVYSARLSNNMTYRFTAQLDSTENYDGASAGCTVTVGRGGGTTGGGAVTVVPPEPDEGEKNEDGSVTNTVTEPDGTVVETTKKADGTTVEKVTTPDEGLRITVTGAEGEKLAEVALPAAIAAPETRFADVPETHWADEAIHNMAALGLVNGVGGNRYDMDAPMSRGALATVLHRLSSKPAGAELSFTDVAEDAYYAEGVAWAAKVGVVEGFGTEIFKPEQTITREQLALMLVRYARLLGMDTAASALALDPYSDSNSAHNWAIGAVAWCVQSGILQGKGDGKLAPTENVTRAQVAVMLDRFLELVQK